MISALWTAFKMLGIWGKIGTGLGNAWDWFTKSSEHMLIAALILVGVHDWLGHRSADKWHSENDKATGLLVTERQESATLRASLASTTKALSDQNTAIAALGAATTAKQQAAQAALRAATARSQASEARAAVIEADASQARSDGKQAATPKVVMDAAKAGDL